MPDNLLPYHLKAVAIVIACTAELLISATLIAIVSPQMISGYLDSWCISLDLRLLLMYSVQAHA